MTKTAVLLATAKQIRCAPLIMAVLMPITSPFVATSGPPELPGLRAASVWMTSSIRRPLRAQESQIGVGIVTEHVRLRLPAFREDKMRTLGLAHDMAVGQDEAIAG